MSTNHCFFLLFIGDNLEFVTAFAALVNKTYKGRPKKKNVSLGPRLFQRQTHLELALSKLGKKVNCIVSNIVEDSPQSFTKFIL